MTDSYTLVYWKVQSKQVGSADVTSMSVTGTRTHVILPQMYVTLHITTAPDSRDPLIFLNLHHGEHTSIVRCPMFNYINQSRTVDIPDELKKSMRKFRFARRNSGSAALIVKIDRNKHIMEEVEQFDDISLEDLAEGMSNCPLK